LRAALERFDELRAAPWADRAQRELRATGERIRRSRPAAGQELTPQELQVALPVAEGKTNKEAAAALFLSPKTVEFHLASVYRKLGVTSRRDLIKRVSTEGVEALAKT
jgi:DNA-binding NarL/FixJ family response regulator